MSFFKQLDEKILEAPNFVYAPSYVLLIERKDSYYYPIDGWYYFETKLEAYSFFGIELPIEKEKNVDN
jgi:hypothetical protein